MKWVLLACLVLACLSAGRVWGDEVVVVRGADGEPEFGEAFERQVLRWKETCERVGAALHVVRSKADMQAVLAGGQGGDEEGEKEKEKEGEEAGAAGRLWLVLVGHGSFDGRTAKFNLEGEDVSAAELGEWVAGCERPLVLVNCSASSAPFLKTCSGPGRIVVTATKDASESSYAYFGEHFAAAVGDVDGADLDNDGGVSVLEAFLAASRRVQAFYTDAGRIASEEALLDDNGDGKGVPAKRFKGVQPMEKVKGGRRLPDGIHAHQVALVPNPEEATRSAAWKAERDALELQVFRLREREAELGEKAWLDAMEEVLLKLARHYRAAEDESESPDDGAKPAVPGDAPFGEAPDTPRGR